MNTKPIVRRAKSHRLVNYIISFIKNDPYILKKSDSH